MPTTLLTSQFLTATTPRQLECKVVQEEFQHHRRPFSDSMILQACTHAVGMPADPRHQLLCERRGEDNPDGDRRHWFAACLLTFPRSSGVKASTVFLLGCSPIISSETPSRESTLGPVRVLE
jgi:hypothetical protein